MFFTRRNLFAALALAVSGFATASNADYFDHYAARRAVFTMSNAADGNAILAYRRAPDGALTPVGSTPTGGLGSGGGLGNQGGLVMSDDGRWMIAVNAGSNDITVFRVVGVELRQVAKAPSGGARPVSVTIDDDLVYVLNAGSDSIAGFRLNDRGQLRPLANSVRPLSATGSAPAQIQFSPGGRDLVITERATNKITIYPVEYNGFPARTPTIVTSPGQTPFGFAFARGRNLLVSEAAGGAPNGSSVSSYLLRRDGSLRVLQPSAPTRQTAACWLATSSDRRFAYTTNTGSSTISAFRIEVGGKLTLLNEDGVAARTNAGPIDMAVAGRLLYTLDRAGGAISMFRIGEDGSLASGPALSGLPASANGLVAR